MRRILSLAVLGTTLVGVLLAPSAGASIPVPVSVSYRNGQVCVGISEELPVCVPPQSFSAARGASVGARAAAAPAFACTPDLAQPCAAVFGVLCRKGCYVAPAGRPAVRVTAEQLAAALRDGATHQAYVCSVLSGPSAYLYCVTHTCTGHICTA